jgi:hypothetical protein
MMLYIESEYTAILVRLRYANIIRFKYNRALVTRGAHLVIMNDSHTCSTRLKRCKDPLHRYAKHGKDIRPIITSIVIAGTKPAAYKGLGLLHGTRLCNNKTHRVRLSPLTLAGALKSGNKRVASTAYSGTSN